MLSFEPIVRMQNRADRAKYDSDTSYFFDLMYMGELALKVMVIELITGLEKTTDDHRYRIEYELVRADSLGKWHEILDDALRGPASQNFCDESRISVGAWSAKFGPGSDSWQRTAIQELVRACDLMAASHDVNLQRKHSLESWAKLLVALRNRTRGHGAPLSTHLAEASRGLENSIRLVCAEAPAFGRSWAYLKRSLSGKYRVTPLGGTRDDYAIYTREDKHFLEDGVYVYLGRPVRTDLFFTDVDLSDFFVPNGSYRNGRRELISYVTDTAWQIEDEKYTLAVEGRRGSETSASPELDVIGDTFSNIPTRPDGYVHRDELESELVRVLSDSRNPVITLKGRGGVGKTSLALAVLHDVLSVPDYFAAVWFSARDIDLLSRGPREVRPDVLSLDDIARLFNGLIRPATSVRDSEAREFMAECLSGESDDGPFLFVFDNFETIREPSQVYEFVNNCVRLPNKILITTRTAEFKSDYPIEIGGLNRDEYGQLVRDLSRKLCIEHLLSESYEEELFKESNGHPYITKILLGEVSVSQRRATAKKVIASQENLLNALFERSFSHLSAAGQRVFLILCGWRSAVPRIGLEAVILRPANERTDVRSAIEELEKFSLIDPVLNDPSGEFLSVPQAAASFGKKKLVTSSYRSVVEADLAFLMAFGSVASSEVSKGLLPRIRKFATFIASEYGEEEAEQGLAVLEFIANDFSPAWLILSELHGEFGHQTESVRCVNRYLQENPRDRDGWSELARLHRSVGSVREEAFALVALAEVTPEFRVLSIGLNSLNRLMSTGEIVDADDREYIIRKMRSLIEPRVAEADSTDLSRLAWLCISGKDLPAAKGYTSTGLKLDPTNTHCMRLESRLLGEAQSG